MVIGIHSIAAFKEKRTGVEEYAYQLIRHMAMLPEAEEHRFLLYADATYNLQPTTYNLPENFEVRVLRWPIMWTQFRLSMEMLRKECDVLFVPAHILPIIHPKNSVVTIHGLEYEYFPKYYPFWFRKYLRFATKYSVKRAKKIIAVSDNTKNDLVKLYGVDEGKIDVVHHGVEKSEIPTSPKLQPASLSLQRGERGERNPKSETNPKSKIQNIENYILYIGRIESKKNIKGIIKAFEIFKEKYNLSHKLVLVGPLGFGYKKIMFHVMGSMFHDDIILAGYVSDKEKEWLYNNASLFLFPSFYEGFGMPILEAQERGVPVITSSVSSMPEVGGEGALYVEPNDYNDIAGKMYALLTNGSTSLTTGKSLRQDIINKGYENVKKFSWEKCAQETLKILETITN